LNSGAAAELFIYNDISWLGTTADQFRSDLKLVGDKPLLVRINSQGGNPVDAVAIYNLLASRRNTTTRVDGMAASAASIIAQAGNPRQIATNAWLMIHEPIVASASGNESDMRAAAESLAAVKTGMAQTYAKRSGKSLAEVQQLMAAETWYTGQQALDAGFADEVVDSIELSASTRLDPKAVSHFKNAPPQLIVTHDLGLPPAATNKENDFMATFAEFLNSWKPGPSDREQRLVKILAKAQVDPEALLGEKDDDGLTRAIEAFKAHAVAEEVVRRETVQASLDSVMAGLVSAGVTVDLTKLTELAAAIQARLDAIASRKMVTLAASRGIPAQATAAGAVNGATAGAPPTYTQQCVEAKAQAA